MTKMDYMIYVYKELNRYFKKIVTSYKVYYNIL